MGTALATVPAELDTIPADVLVDVQDNSYTGTELFLVRFPNGYGASIRRGGNSYGRSEGLWEVGVVEHNPERLSDWSLTYDTYLTDDVLGWQSVADVARVLREIQELPSRV